MHPGTEPQVGIVVASGATQPPGPLLLDALPQPDRAAPTYISFPGQPERAAPTWFAQRQCGKLMKIRDIHSLNGSLSNKEKYGSSSWRTSTSVATDATSANI